MTKKILLFYAAGMVIGISIGFATHNLAVGMGVGVALAFAFSRGYERRRRR
jgi:hypothetical protein